jgi:hypothetical protein
MRSRSASATTTNSAANASWIVIATRSGCPPERPCARSRAIVRASSCSTGR